MVADAKINHLSPIVTRLVALWRGPVADDYGILRPTRHAIDTALRLLIDAAIISKLHHDNQIPHGCVSSDSEGGLRIEWVRDRSSVHLVIPASDCDQGSYIYHEVGDQYVTVSAEPESLARWLRDIS